MKPEKACDFSIYAFFLQEVAQGCDLSGILNKLKETCTRLGHPVSSDMEIETIELCGLVGTKPKKGKNCQSLALIYDKTQVFVKLDMISTSWTEKGAVFAVLKKIPPTGTSSCEDFETCFGEQMILMGKLFVHLSLSATRAMVRISLTPLSKNKINRYTRREKSAKTTKAMDGNDDTFDMYKLPQQVS